MHFMERVYLEKMICFVSDSYQLVVCCTSLSLTFFKELIVIDLEFTCKTAKSFYSTVREKV